MGEEPKQKKDRFDAFKERKMASGPVRVWEKRPEMGTETMSMGFVRHT
jgi:hypothetical protein